ncbi:MAG: FAD-dependent oxidoreductase [Thermoplasmatota archaeon]
MDILVLGRGVIGLSTAIRLSERGHRVTVFAKAGTPHTTSDVAAAIFFPVMAEPRDRILAWGTRSFEAFQELSAKSPSTRTGIVWRETLVLEPHAPLDTDGDTHVPWWGPMVGGTLPAKRGQLRPGYPAGWRFRVPVIEMPVYLRFLEEQFAAMGGRFEAGYLDYLDAPRGRADVVINCTGLGARSLVPDPSMLPIRGQVARTANPGLDTAFLVEGGPMGIAYVIPRLGDVVLGGTSQEGDERERPDPADEATILTKAAALCPALQGMQVSGRAVGLRPGRPTIRLEPDAARPWLVHNYGHGGSGVTLSWGCAEEAAMLAEKIGARGRGST